MHERQTPRLIDRPNDLEARKMLIAIASGDRSALTKLYMSYYGCLAHFLSQFIGSNNRVGDVINDTFMTIWGRAREFPFESVSVWIFRIAHRHASRFVQCHTPAASVHRPLLWTLQRLPTEQRVVLTLCYRMGCSVREIALITDSQVETVESRLFQARRQLRRYLTPLDKQLEEFRPRLSDALILSEN
ncbi:MAG: polymerase subunit sigma-70 [Gammaproteobacteria bacterium]|nr:polymerase subunit sigma-70 [Gammaproteobacteria bacterium]